MNFDMKKIFLFAFLCLLVFTSCANGANKKKASVDNSELSSLVNEYRHVDGFHAIRVGSMGTSIAKMILKSVAKEDKDAQLVSNIAEGVRKVVIIEYDDASTADKDAFTARFKDCIRNSELLLEAKDDDDMVKLYGITTEDGSAIRDIILYTPSENAVVCMFGKVEMNDVSKLIEANI